MSAAAWQLIWVDGLFLFMVVGMGLWFRAWLRREKEEMDVRLQALEKHQAQLDRVCGRLQTVCRSLEFMGREERPSVDRYVERREVANEPSVESEDVYERAWNMLARGETASEVARALGIGLAEVELMGRMSRYRR